MTNTAGALGLVAIIFLGLVGYLLLMAAIEFDSTVLKFGFAVYVTIILMALKDIFGGRKPQPPTQPK